MAEMDKEGLQRVAKAIFPLLACDPDWDDAYITKEQADRCDNEDISQEECLEIARAAIEAWEEHKRGNGNDQ